VVLEYSSNAKGVTRMADVKLEQKQSLSRKEAAVWLHALSRAFERGGEAALPMPGGATVEFRPPDEVAAEFELGVDGDEVEIEIEFKWSTSNRSSAEEE
jgi:amphi-Trp domain-containing protein